MRLLTAACIALGLLAVPGCVTAQGDQPGGPGELAMMQHGPDGKPMMQPGPDGHMPGGHMQDGKECNCPMMKRAEQAGAETPPASPETPPPAHSTPPHEE